MARGGQDAEERFRSVFAQLPEVVAYARRRGSRDPEGVAAETMTIAWRKLADVPVDDPRPWLYATARKRFKPVGGQALFVVGVDGKGLRRLTQWNLEAGGELDWSPDGTRILFRTVTAAGNGPGPSLGDIYTVRPDGSGLQRLTHFPAGTGVQLGSYSPDGTRIVFATTKNATAGPASFWPDLFTMNADGSNITPLTRTKNWEGTPDCGTG
jgi:hypothetical protein